jgi:hypothetical protein
LSYKVLQGYQGHQNRQYTSLLFIGLRFAPISHPKDRRSQQTAAMRHTKSFLGATKKKQRQALEYMALPLTLEMHPAPTEK